MGFKTSQESSQLKAEVLRYLGVVRLRVRWGRAPFSSSHLGEKYIGFYQDFPGGSDGTESAYNAGDLGSIPGQEDPLEKGMATCSNIFA